MSHLALAALHAKHEEPSKPAEEAREDSRLHWAADTKPCQRYSSGNNNSNAPRLRQQEVFVGGGNFDRQPRD
jgi:hypothetical protein